MNDHHAACVCDLGFSGADCSVSCDDICRTDSTGPFPYGCNAGLTPSFCYAGGGCGYDAVNFNNPNACCMNGCDVCADVSCPLATNDCEVDAVCVDGACGDTLPRPDGSVCHSELWGICQGGICVAGDEQLAPPPPTIATCTAFETTFPTTPTGFVAIDASATTVAGVGLTCDADAHYIGTAVLTCDGTTFASPSGCELQGQCGSSPVCPAGYQAAAGSEASYCAGATCDLVDDAADTDSDDDEVYAHDLATCCESSTSTPTPTPTPSDSVDIGGADYNIDWRVGGVPYPDMTASVGETIAFSYSSQHNVFLLTSGNCEPSGSTELGGTLDSPVLFELTEAGVYTFACQIGDHCADGMIFSVTVSSDEQPATPDPDPSPSPTPATAPAAAGDAIWVAICSGVDPGLRCDVMQLIDRVRDATPTQLVASLAPEVFCPCMAVRAAHLTASPDVAASCRPGGGGGGGGR